MSTFELSRNYGYFLLRCLIFKEHSLLSARRNLFSRDSFITISQGILKVKHYFLFFSKKYSLGCNYHILCYNSLIELVNLSPDTILHYIKEKKYAY